MGGLFLVVAAFLAQSGVFDFRQTGIRGGFGGKRGIVRRLYQNLPCILQAEGQGKTVQAQFDGVAHRGTLLQHHFHAGNHSHVQEVLAQGTASAHLHHNGAFLQFEFAQFHFLFIIITNKSVPSIPRAGTFPAPCARGLRR